MSWSQKTFSLSPRTRGSYLITDEVVQAVPEIANYKVGLLNLFIQHTSAALTLNENWDPDVRDDMTDALDRVAPESAPYRHDDEGPDDMPAHVKSSLIGASLTIPIKDGRLATGTWQGIWLCEFRRYRHQRKIVATIQGERK
ncbi:secondary thiamine-phosphate synthase [Dipodascopsis tothii]|uniref:secondary thiamine-phosphate synthase n=1 Tax=Dipodascopsis tothii TaxID=44089 RepID=UPI0034CD78E0